MRRNVSIRCHLKLHGFITRGVCAQPQAQPQASRTAPTSSRIHGLPICAAACARLYRYSLANAPPNGGCTSYSPGSAGHGHRHHARSRHRSRQLASLPEAPMQEAEEVLEVVRAETHAQLTTKAAACHGEGQRPVADATERTIRARCSSLASPSSAHTRSSEGAPGPENLARCPSRCACQVRNSDMATFRFVSLH